MENRDTINKRIRNIKLVALVCALAILTKFTIVTVYYREGFTELANYQSSVELTQPLPRGEVYDSEGVLLAGNELTYDLMYIEPGIKDSDELFEDAQKITDLIEIDGENLTVTQVMDIWLSLTSLDEDGEEKSNSVIAYERLSESEQKTYGDLDDQDVAENATKYLEMNELLYSTIKDEELQSLVDEYGKDVLYVKSLMGTATTKTPVTIKADLSLEEVYKIDNEVGNLGGFIVIDDWQRKYPEGDTLRTFLGRTGSIAAEDQTLYESQGYSLDETVGVSYLEKELESILHSTPQTIECYFDENGNLVRTEIVDDGELGNDVQLTINIEFQKYVEKILEQQLTENDYIYDTDVYSVVTNPQNGNLLAIGGIHDDSINGGDMYEYSIGTFTSAYPIGSIVKPAVLLMGYDLDAWDWNKYVYDAPMKIKGTPTKASFHDYGSINETQAIALSSNVYFYQLLLAIAGETYVENEALDISKEYFDLVRKEFEQFGLGTSTGIQMENETLGVQGSEYNPGFYLDLANGQYDTYTTMQAAQMVSTIANGGTRYRMNYIDKIYTAGGQGTYGKVLYEQEPVVLNQLSMDDKDIEHTQNAMETCSQVVGSTIGTGYNGGYNAASLNTMGACKTGTSEDFYWDENTETLTAVNNASFIAYAPVDDPEFAIATLLPHYTNDANYTASRRNGAYYSHFIQNYYFKEIAND